MTSISYIEFLKDASVHMKIFKYREEEQKFVVTSVLQLLLWTFLQCYTLPGCNVLYICNIFS